MSAFNFCRKHCSSGEVCFMPNDFEAIADLVGISVDMQEPVALIDTELGQKIDSSCMRLERFRESIGIELFLPEANTPQQR